MARVLAPLMSQNASGKYAGTLVFMPTRGRHYVRQLVHAADPRTAAQVTNRNRFRAARCGIFFATHTAMIQQGQAAPDRVNLQALAGPGKSWHRLLTAAIIGPAGAHYDAAAAFWLTSTHGVHNAWDTAATSVVPPFTSAKLAPPYPAGYSIVRPSLAFILYLHGLHKLSIGADPLTPVPIVYA